MYNDVQEKGGLLMNRLSYSIAMEISGNTAMWTRPDTGDCPVSYPAPTYSAVKAMFKSVYWAEAVEIIPLKVELCRPVQYHSYTTNYGGPLRKDVDVKKGNSFQLLATVLVDVCYKLYAEVMPKRDKSTLPESALEWDRKTTSPGHAYQAIFYRRLKRGQCYSIPVLGWKEFTPSYYGCLRDDTNVMTDLSPISIPSMFRDIVYGPTLSFEYDQNVVIQNGCLSYPKMGDSRC
jgi:CRISPR-associated protein Cas5d